MRGVKPDFVIMDEAADAPSDPFDLLEEPEEVAARAAAQAEAQQQLADDTRTVTMASFYSTAPSWLTSLLASLRIYRDVAWTHSSEDRVEAGMIEDGRRPAKRMAEAEVVASAQKSAGDDDSDEDYKPMHVLALDIDHSAVLLPSSTPGHAHLVINHWLSHEAWEEIITVLGKHGVIEEGYASVSVKRKSTFLRLPWIRKRWEREDRNAAYLDWIDLPAGQDFTAGPQERNNWLRGLRDSEHTDTPF